MYENKSSMSEEVVESIVWPVSGWASNGKKFADIPLQDIYRSWTIISQEGGQSKPVISTSWVHPPTDIWKFNFDSSFVKELGKGGWLGRGDKR